MNILIKYFSLNKYYLFLAVVAANMLLMWLSKTALINDMVIYNTYSEQLSYERSMELFKGFQKYSWIVYAFMPFILLIKFSLISTVIYTGIFFCNLHEKVNFKKVFGVVIASEVVFLSANLVKVLWFCFFAGNYDLNDISFFYPLSLSNIFSQSELDKIWIYPLQLLNLFQIIYILFLSYGLFVQSRIEKLKAEKAVLVSYLPGLAIWVAFYLFLSIGSSL